MGKIGRPLPVKVFFGLIGREEFLSAAAAEIAAVCGELADPSPRWAFDHTDYYRREMGEDLQRQFFAAVGLRESEELVALKLATNELEERLSAGGRRRLNIDPGYLSASKVVLATTKDYGHRLYLGSGIYGEVTLKYREGEYVACEHTYPDYRGRDYRLYFGRLREKYMADLKEKGERPCPS